jgi:hypothetical protein
MKKPAFMRNALGRRLVSAVAAAVFSGFGVAAYAGDLSVSGNSVTVTWSGGGAGAKTITSGGIVGDVSGIPNVVGTIGFPNFAFTLQQSGVANGAYTFAAGFIIDEVGTDRRIELYLPNVTMTFSSGVLTGSITNGQTVSVRGRNADSTVSAVATLSNNSASFDGATLSFNAGNQLSKLNAAGGILADVAATILNATDARYTYAVFLNQTGGPDNIRFISNGTSTAYPCSNGSEFVINAGSSLVSTFNGSYVLQGKLAFGAAVIGGSTFTPSGTCNTVGAATTTTTTDGTTTTEATTTTTTSSTTSSSTSTTSSTTSSSTSSTSSTTGETTTTTSTLPAITTTTVALPTTTTVVYQNTAALEAIQSSFATQLTTVTAPSTEQVQNINAFVSSGLATITANVAPASTVIGLLDLLGTSIAKQGDQVPNAATEVSLNLVTTLVSSVNVAALTPTEKTNMLDKVALAVASTATSVESKDNITPAELSTNLAAMGNALTAAANKLNGGVLSDELVAVAIELAAAAEEIASSQATSPATVQEKVAAAKVVLAKAASRLLGKAIVSGDAPATLGEYAATVVNGLDPANVQLEVTSGQFVNGLASLVGALNISGSTATYINATGVTEIQAGTKFVPAFLVESALVSSSIADGIIVDANGAAIAIKSNLASTYVPASRDLVGLVTALENANLTVTIESDGSLNLVTPTGGRFAGTFGFTDVKKGTLTTAPVTFTQPSGDPKTTNYFYTVNYSDGSSQRVAPYVAADGFYSSLSALKFRIQTDRSTGVIVGPGNIRYRPSYFVTPNTAADLVYHGSARDRFDISYRRVDANGDGLQDYEVITSSGKQLLYRME